MTATKNVVEARSGRNAALKSLFRRRTAPSVQSGPRDARVASEVRQAARRRDASAADYDKADYNKIVDSLHRPAVTR